jgi:hypothetical protein
LSQKIKSILFISAFGKVTEKYSNDRVCSLYDYFEIEDKTIIITDFDHLKKEKRTGDFNLRNAVYLPVLRYKSNIGLGRIFSHWSFAWRLNQYLKKLKNKPDVIYCLVPTPSSCWVAGRYANKNGIFFVSDIIDVWPDGLYTVSKVLSKIVQLITLPWKILFVSSIKKSNLIVTANSNYTNIAKKLTQNKIETHTTFLGSNQSITLSPKKREIKIKDCQTIKIAYGGNLGKGYDFEAMFEGVNILSKSVKNKIEFHIIGGGDLDELLKEQAKLYTNFTTIFSGKIQYSEFLKLLQDCDIALNIFRENNLVSMSYKLYDYFKCGLIVINNLTGDSSLLIDQYGVGVNTTTDKLGDSLVDVVNESIKLELKFEELNDSLSNDVLLDILYRKINYGKNKVCKKSI